MLASRGMGRLLESAGPALPPKRSAADIRLRRPPRAGWLTLAVFVSLPGFAAEDVDAPSPEHPARMPETTDVEDRAAGEVLEEKAKTSPGALQKMVDAMHDGISSRVERAALTADSFFADDRYYADGTETYARLSLQSTWENGEDTEARARVRARVDLPGTEERIRLFLEGGDPEEQPGSGSDSIPQALDDNDYNLGLEAQLKNTGAWDVRPGLGVKAAIPPDPFVRIRAIRYERLKKWLFRFSAGAAEYLDDGTELQTRLDFDRKLATDWLFRSASRLRRLDSKDQVELDQQFSVFQRLSGHAGVAYDIGLRASDEPDWDVDNYYTQVRARFRAYKKWLFVEITPQLLFREEDDYDPSFRFSLRLDAVFGEQYRDKREATSSGPRSRFHGRRHANATGSPARYTSP